MFASDIPACQEILRTILEDEKLIVNDVIVQSSERNIYGRSVRLDALCMLGDGSLCNIEIQRSDSDNHLKRAWRKNFMKQMKKAIAITLACAMVLSGTGNQFTTKKAKAASGYKLNNPTTNSNGVSTWDCIYFGNYWQDDTNGDGTADKQGIYELQKTYKSHSRQKCKDNRKEIIC